MDEIIPNLWLGDIGDCLSAVTPGKIDRVISLCPEFSEISCFVEDRWQCGFADRAPVNPLKIHYALTLAIPCLKQGGRVLIHCAGGRSRSPMVVACLLVAMGQQHSFEAAVEFVHSKRSTVEPHAAIYRSGVQYCESPFLQAAAHAYISTHQT